ncbi:MAG: YlbG family protein [Vagococcus sp.]|uniref:YlbG family protein n=1 Tax=Vagococcus sp. TaxID=1933889 RepID=UPI002FC73531
MLVNESENNTLELVPRRGLIVWVYSLKQLKNLRRFGYVHYVSKKMKYVVLYVDDIDVETTVEKISKQFFVRSVEMSMRPDINMNFDNRLGNKEIIEGEPLEFEEQKTEIRLAEFVEE